VRSVALLQGGFSTAAPQDISPLPARSLASARQSKNECNDAQYYYLVTIMYRFKVLYLLTRHSLGGGGKEGLLERLIKY